MAKHENIYLQFDATELIKQMKMMRFELMVFASDIIAGDDIETQLNELGISTEDGEAKD